MPSPSLVQAVRLISPMEVILNDFKSQWAEIETEALAAIQRVGQSGWIVLGKEVSRFETSLAALMGARHAIGCANGLDALEISLRILGIGRGEKVLTTPLSAFATTLAIQKIGAVPCFVDVDSCGLIDLDKVDRVLEQESDIKAMVPVHLYGHALDLSRLEKIKNKFKIKIIEDCAQAIGAMSGSRSVGTVGDMAALSFYPTKNLGALGDGGAILTSTAQYATLARSLRDYGQTAKYVHEHLGYNSRLDELHAAILNDALLPRLEGATVKREKIAHLYINGITNPAIKVIAKPPHSTSVWHLFPVLVNGPRASFQAHMKEKLIQTGIHYPFLITNQKALTNHSKFEVFGTLEAAQQFAEHEVSLPIHPYMLDAEISRVIQACNSWRF
jgi:dTDP-4-amino-4,6-dideoxygalactose transaminase